MNLLYITFGLPYPPDSGARLRDFNLIKRVSGRHKVSVLSLLEFEDELQHAETLATFCQHVDGVQIKRSLPATLLMAIRCLFKGRPLATAPFYFTEFARKITRLTEQHQFDIVQIEHSFLAPYRAALSPRFDGRTILSMHNIGESQYRSILQMTDGPGRIPARLKCWMMKNWETREANQFDHVITVSDCDQKRLLSSGLKRPVSVIENGVDCEQLQPLPETDEGSEELIFIGTMGYLPNRDAARYMATEILPKVRARHPSCKLKLVGSGGKEHLADLECKDVVEVTGRVNDPLPWYASSKLAVVPLRSGGGSRLKILEALALGRPVISTSMGSEGLTLEDGIDVMIADDSDAFANAIVDLLENGSKRQDMIRAGRDRVEKCYDWNILADRLSGVYTALERREQTA